MTLSCEPLRSLPTDRRAHQQRDPKHEINATTSAHRDPSDPLLAVLTTFPTRLSTNAETHLPRAGMSEGQRRRHRGHTCVRQPLYGRTRECACWVLPQFPLTPDSQQRPRSANKRRHRPREQYPLPPTNSAPTRAPHTQMTVALEQLVVFERDRRRR
jgi:hypothetical protein